MSNKVHVKTGDEVVVINGKYRGKRGKVQLVCPKCGRPTRTGSKINAKGKKVRTCKKSDCLAEFE